MAAAPASAGRQAPTSRRQRTSRRGSRGSLGLSRVDWGRSSGRRSWNLFTGDLVYAGDDDDDDDSFDNGDDLDGDGEGGSPIINFGRRLSGGYGRKGSGGKKGRYKRGGSRGSGPYDSLETDEEARAPPPSASALENAIPEWMQRVADVSFSPSFRSAAILLP